MRLILRARYLGTTETGMDAEIEVGNDVFQIGRSDSSQLVLPDVTRFISNKHATVSWSPDGGFMLLDTSGNGTLFNGEGMEKSVSQELRVADEIRIGEYSLVVADVLPDQQQEPSPEPFPDPFPDPSPGPFPDPFPDPSPGPFPDPFPDPSPGPFPDPFPDPSPGPFPDPFPDPSPGPFPDPFPDPAPGPFPDPFPDPGPLPEPTPEPTPEPRPSPVAPPIPDPIAGDRRLEAFSRGLGLDPNRVLDAETLEEMGAVLKVLLDGLVGMLHARSEFKNALRLVHTHMQATGNNPFKNSATGPQLLELLFFNPQPGFLAASPATAELIEDLAAHELAVFEGIKGIGQKLTERIDPQKLEGAFKGQLKFAAGIDALAKAQYWDAFKGYYQDELVDRDPLTEDFAKVYNEALLQLESRRT